jgi:hypothetical protein
VRRYVGKINMKLLFVFLQTLLYVAFLTLDLTDGSIVFSNKIKFTIIVLCFCYVLFYKSGANRSIIFCSQAALFFTVISDLFILLLDYYFYGVLTFVIVQQLYGMRLILERRSDRGSGIIKIDFTLWGSFLARILIQAGFTAVVCILLSQTGVILERLLVTSVFYFICILMNAITAVKAAFKDTKEKSKVIFAVGIFLFLLCDINVGLFNLSGFISMPEHLYGIIYSFSAVLMWTFYAPAQVLLALSVRGVNNLR